MKDGWFNYQQAADYLDPKIPGGFTERAVMKSKATGDLHYTKIRGRVWFSKADLDAFVTKITTTGARP